ncbi:sulfite oxidase heme-binding subunit YedZ [Zhongshania aliphaticivorans]|uniref:sulfite oxidase heme-binding subunit YedZ n=1 Tax=Zhongshania aliphaticivorans TaxID=1470434 RepID=UPI0012E576AC|nr:protein-methionine-sulfoxide reductase heme-binding subunit MsrQ [Zhongshania aliphaticivorans]CAA0114544.1 Protein-methionine-sulfoxide reductase heme-binding subunit MsrQ [Zhongshania aliphaticivorans]
MAMLTSRQLRIAKAVVFILCLLPLTYIVYAALTENLGTDPVKSLIHITGEWAIRLFVLTMAISPMRAWLGWGWALRFRRMLGLYTWFYATIHLLIVTTYIFAWDWQLAKIELAERAYIFVGFAAWVLMMPLGLTSNNRAVRALRKNWGRLHMLVYPAVLLAWLHIAWQVRSSYFDAVLYAVLIICLLFQRFQKLKKRL